MVSNRLYSLASFSKAAKMSPPLGFLAQRNSKYYEIMNWRKFYYTNRENRKTANSRATKAFLLLWLESSTGYKKFLFQMKKDNQSLV